MADDLVPQVRGRAGLGIALVPRMGRAPLGEELVALRAGEPRPVREVLAVHRRSMGASPAVTVVLDALAVAGARVGQRQSG